jgi:hypothetical protein
MGKNKIEEIINLQLFTRSSRLYKDFENRAKDLNEVEISYLFCKECENRAKNLDFIKEWLEVRDNSTSREEKEKFTLIYNEQFEELKKIDFDLYAYYNNLFESVVLNPLEDATSKQYSVKTMIDEPVLLKVLGEERVNELLYDGYPDYIQDNKGFPYLDIEELLQEKSHITLKIELDDFKSESIYKPPFLTKSEKMALKKHIKLNPFGFRTMVLRDYTKQQRDLSSSHFVEIDFSKPIEEIEHFIKSVKKDFDNNPKKLPTMYDLLGIKRKTIEFHTLKSDIYRGTNKKSNEQLLADILFIYDCNKANYTQADIQQEFQLHYRNKIGIKKDTIKKYLEFAKKYINKKKYLEFINP